MLMSDLWAPGDGRCYGEGAPRDGRYYIGEGAQGRALLHPGGRPGRGASGYCQRTEPDVVAAVPGGLGLRG
jgi:hypothetical protein